MLNLIYRTWFHKEFRHAFSLVPIHSWTIWHNHRHNQCFARAWLCTGWRGFYHRYWMGWISWTMRRNEHPAMSEFPCQPQHHCRKRLSCERTCQTLYQGVQSTSIQLPRYLKNKWSWWNNHKNWIVRNALTICEVFFEVNVRFDGSQSNG